MDRFRLKRYRKEAALWAGQGARAMSIDPADLLWLLDNQQATAQPVATELADLRRNLAEAQANARRETARAQENYERGYAAGVRAAADETRRLRAALAQTSAKKVARDDVR